jgi:hypothetical protein
VPHQSQRAAPRHAVYWIDGHWLKAPRYLARLDRERRLTRPPGVELVEATVGSYSDGGEPLLVLNALVIVEAAR